MPKLARRGTILAGEVALLLLLAFAQPGQADAQPGALAKRLPRPTTPQKCSTTAARPTMPQNFIASWYSEASLKKEGTWNVSHGIMANGQKFDETKWTCATRAYPLGSVLQIEYAGNTIRVRVTDRIGKRFANSRIDLSRKAFSALADLNRGVIPVKVRRVE